MLPPGGKLSHFEILERLGQGGMGVVYKARDLRLNRVVAIKVLPADVVSDRDRQTRFQQEARAASALNHPNIITIYEIDAIADVVFIAMEYVDGRTLEQSIPQKGLRYTEAMQYAVQIASALAAAHDAGIVHRDVKPANIMITGKGAVKILDFGVAKLGKPDLPQRIDEAQLTLTWPASVREEGTIAGTPAYMSPEQAEGKKLDRRSDIFSFGVVLYEMLTGRHPFRGETRLSTIAAILNQEPKPAREIVEALPVELNRVLARCLRKDPARRFQNMADVRVALEELLEELKVEADSGRLGPTVPPPTRSRSRTPILVLAAVCVLGAAGLAWRLLRPAAAPEISAKLLPLTTYPGNEFAPAISPDGKQVAFVWNGEKQNNYDIYVNMVEGGGPPLRLTTGPERDGYPAWSPDGKYIAFTRAGGIYLISPLGGPERKVCDFHVPGSSRLSWSPDAKLIAFADRSTGNDPFRLFTVALDTGDKRPLTDPAAGSAGDSSPAFSPDGRWLAFSRSRVGGAAALFMIPARGGNPRRLTPVGHLVGGIAWTPDSRDLVFAANPHGTWALWRISANAPNDREPMVVPGAAGEPGGAAIGQLGPHGPWRLIYDSVISDDDVWRFDLPNGGHPTPLIASTRDENSARYSPDRKRIVFRSNRSGFYEIWVCDADGANAVQLTYRGLAANSPHWSPDGRLIAFDGLTEANRDIYAIPSVGGAPRRITTEPSEESRPSFSQDGRWIYFMSDRSGTRQIWKIPTQGGAAVQITKQGGLEPNESPDGKMLYYIHKRRAPGLRSVPVEGGEENTPIESAALGGWGLTRDGIYFADRSAVPASATKCPLKFYSFKTRQVSQTAELEYAFQGPDEFSVSPDGRWALAVRTNSRGADLFLLDGFR